jgi:hypothetical protein
LHNCLLWYVAFEKISRVRDHLMVGAKYENNYILTGWNDNNLIIDRKTADLIARWCILLWPECLLVLASEAEKTHLCPSPCQKKNSELNMIRDAGADLSL